MTEPQPPTDKPLAAATIPDSKRRGRWPRWLRWTVVGIVTVVVAAVLMPSLLPSCACGKPPLASMKSDLRNLVDAEESYFSEYTAYTTSTALTYFTPSAGVTITIVSASGTGWAATAKHRAEGRTCGIFIGSAAAPIAGQKDGEPKCVDR